MDFLKELEEAMKVALREIPNIKVSRDALAGDLAAFRTQKSVLESEVKTLREEALSIKARIADEKKREIEMIESKLRDAADLKAGVEQEKQKVASLQVQLQADRDTVARKELEVDKRRLDLDSLITQYTEKVKKFEEFYQGVK